MQSITLISLAIPSLLVASLLSLAGGKPDSAQAATSEAPKAHKAQISNQFTATAEVVAVAPADRLVTLRREDGTQIQVQCSDAVRNFDRIAVGNVLRVRYEAKLTAELRPGESAKPMEGAVTAARARVGAKPGAGVGMAASVRVKIESIDREHAIVVFSLASGELVAHRLKTDEGREFVRGLAVGDVVQLDYAEVVALSVETI